MRPAQFSHVEELMIHLTTVALSDCEDIYQWIINGSRRNTFCSSMVYNIIRPPAPQVQWYPLIWIKHGIPKHKSMAWLFTLNRCPTRDRLLSWDLQTDHLCLLCNREPESRDHIFFHCKYSFNIWNTLARKFHLPPTSPDWLDVIDGLLSISDNAHRKYLSRLSWQAMIYEFWKERSGCLHRNTNRTTTSLLKVIESTIKNWISSFRHHNPTLATNCMQFWLSLA